MDCLLPFTAVDGISPEEAYGITADGICSISTVYPKGLF